MCSLLIKVRLQNQTSIRHVFCFITISHSERSESPIQLTLSHAYSLNMQIIAFAALALAGFSDLALGLPGGEWGTTSTAANNWGNSKTTSCTTTTESSTSVVTKVSTVYKQTTVYVTSTVSQILCSYNTGGYTDTEKVHHFRAHDVPIDQRHYLRDHCQRCHQHRDQAVYLHSHLSHHLYLLCHDACGQDEL